MSLPVVTVPAVSRAWRGARRAKTRTLTGTQSRIIGTIHAT